MFLERISGTCNGTYEDDAFSYITSPNYPENYAANEDCIWTINTLDKRTFLLHFVDFETESHRDHLHMYDGSNDEGMSLGVLHGSTIPSDVWLIGKAMHLRFTSNRWTHKKGFKILVEMLGNHSK